MLYPHVSLHYEYLGIDWDVRLGLLPEVVGETRELSRQYPSSNSPQSCCLLEQETHGSMVVAQAGEMKKREHWWVILKVWSPNNWEASASRARKGDIQISGTKRLDVIGIIESHTYLVAIPVALLMFLPLTFTRVRGCRWSLFFEKRHGKV